MPKKMHLLGVGIKEQRQYEHIKESGSKVRPIWQANQRSSSPDGAETAQGRGPSHGEVDLQMRKA